MTFKTFTAIAAAATVLLTPATAEAAHSHHHKTVIKAVSDSVTVTAGDTVNVNVTNNDKITKHTKLSVVTNPIPLTTNTDKKHLVTISTPTTSVGTYTVVYKLKDKNKTSKTSITVTVNPKDTTITTTTTTTTTTTDDATLLENRIAALPIGSEERTGYDRDLFKLWIDADHDGCDTRDEVLISEATTTPTIGSNCSLSGGTWTSYYDNITTTDPSTFDIDHLVPLAEAWDSGANTWDTDTRTRYANDLDDPRTLVAVSASANRSKGDQDPAEWMPPQTSAACRYITEWVAIKTRWSLTVNNAEKNALTNIDKTDNCPNVSVPVTPAAIGHATTSGTTGTGTTGSSISLTSITFNPDGDDATGEYVTLTNNSNNTVNLQGWTLQDAAAHTYTFPTSAIPSKSQFTVKAPTGTNQTSGTNPVFYAGWGAIWNNDTDTATLTDNTGTTIDTCSYDTTSKITATC